MQRDTHPLVSTSVLTSISIPRQSSGRSPSRTRAILPVHYAGLPCEMDSIWQIARPRARVVEDAAHVAGAAYRGISAGLRRAMRWLSASYATKNLTTGEGGMVTTSSAELSERMRILCLHGSADA